MEQEGMQQRVQLTILRARATISEASAGRPCQTSARSDERDNVRAFDLLFCAVETPSKRQQR